MCFIGLVYFAYLDFLMDLFNSKLVILISVEKSWNGGINKWNYLYVLNNIKALVEFSDIY